MLPTTLPEALEVAAPRRDAPGRRSEDFEAAPRNEAPRRGFSLASTPAASLSYHSWRNCSWESCQLPVGRPPVGERRLKPLETPRSSASLSASGSASSARTFGDACADIGDSGFAQASCKSLESGGGPGGGLEGRLAPGVWHLTISMSSSASFCASLVPFAMLCHKLRFLGVTSGEVGLIALAGGS